MMSDSSDDTQRSSDGSGSPVIAQTPQTLARDKERIKKRGAIGNRSQGVRRKLRLDHSRSRSRSPTPTPVAATSSGRNRRAQGRQQRAEAQIDALHTAQASLNTIRESRATTDDSVTSPETTSERPPAVTQQPKERVKKSPIWKHCKRIVGDNNVVIVACNYCKSQYRLSGSTSTALQHIRSHHQDKMTEQEKLELNRNEHTTFDSKTPKRQIRGYGDMCSKILHTSYKGMKLNKSLCLALITGSVPFKFLDNPHFGMYVETLSGNQYNLPSRTYMSTSVMPSIHHKLKQAVSDLLKNKKYISFTTDCWRSFNKDSYITVTAHFIDEDHVLHTLVLDTSEIKVRHTAGNLYKHIKGVLEEWGLNSNADYVGLNFNNINAQNIFADDEEPDDEVDYLRTLEVYGNDEHLTPMSESEPEMSQSSTQMSESQTQMLESHFMTEPTGNRSHGRNVNQRNLTFVSDNAGDIKSALSVTGKFNWLGCAGHNLNLVIKEAFKKVIGAAELLKKCKLLVQAINHSLPLLNCVRSLQEEFNIGINAILQEMIVRWWSILDMLKSIEKSFDPITLALVHCDKSHLALTSNDRSKIKEIIKLLEPFKLYVEMFSKETDVTVTLIKPYFQKLENKVLIEKPDDSQMISDMKTHMLKKLKTRYNTEQLAFLDLVTFFDPRYKGDVTPNQYLLKKHIKSVVEASGPNIIPPTQDQEYVNLQNERFATTTPMRDTPIPYTHTLFDSDSDEELPRAAAEIDTKIETELQMYSKLKFNAKEKKETHVLKWWNEKRNLFPCLSETVKALLHTPATSVPSERIFSEAGYIARARRSRILPKNLNKFIFIKKNIKYMKDLQKEDLEQLQEETEEEDEVCTTDY